MKNLLLVSFLLLSFSLTAQNFSITGKVTDANNLALPGAHVSLLHPWGEAYNTTVTEADGQFKFEHIGQGGYVFKISFLGYADYQGEVTVSNQSVDVGSIRLEEGATDLNEVEVTEKIPIAIQKGDTTQFNADAFKTLPDANAEELVEKMPGIIVDNGKVQAQGEDVKEVLVDGRPFFGNDPTAALRNLPAEVIDKIQVFDQKSDQANFSGFDDGETSKTINIITRPNMRNGQFGKVYAGYGHEERYKAGGNASLFDGKRRISIIAQTNNINEQNFSTEDLLGVVGSSGRRGRGGFRGRGGGSRGGRGGGGSVNDFLVNQQGGIAMTNALGVNYSDKWGEKFDISGSYFFNLSENDSETNSNTEYIGRESVTQFYDELNSSNTDNMNHRLNLRMTYQIDSANSIIIRPRLSLQVNEGLSTTLGTTMINGTLANQFDNIFRSDLTGIDFSNSLLFRHRFAKRGRTFSISFSTRYSDKSGDNHFNSFETSVPDTIPIVLDQFSELDVTGWNLSTNLSYTEPLGERGRLMLNYRTSWQDDDSNKKTFDYSEATGEYDELNDPLSSVFTNKLVTQQFGGGYSWSKGRDFNLMARGNFQVAKLNADQTFPTTQNLNRTYVNVLPMVMLRYNFDRQENLRVFYRSRTQAPSVEQLQEVIDNSNAPQYSIGNPNLDQSYTHSLFARYSKTNTEKATAFFILINGSYSDNYISNATWQQQTDNPVFDNFSLNNGEQLSQPVNLTGYWTARTFMTYGVPIKPIKSNLNFDFSANYSRTPSLINDAFNYSKTQTVGVGLTLSSNISDKIDFTIGTRSNFNNVENTLRAAQNDRYLNQKSKLRIGWVLPTGLVFRTNIIHQLYTGLADGFDDSYFLWSAGIGKKLFKNQRGELTLSVFDLLGQNQSISRNITQTYIEDVRTNVLQRYLMLTFTYNFRNFNTGKAPPPERERGKDRGPWRDRY